MRIALCDDNKDWLETEKEYIDCMNDSTISYDIFESGEELMSVYRSHGSIYDVVFLDMEMNRLDGINTANMIRSIDRSVLIVFVTSHKKYMQKSFECRPFHFLLKPIDFIEFKKIVLALINELEEDKKALVFNENRDIKRLPYEDIVFIQSIDHCIYIKTVDNLHQTYNFKMADIKAKLQDSRFVQIHKSYIINMRYIKQISKKNVTMRGYGHEIPVSLTYREQLKRRVMLYEERKHLS